MTPKELLEHRPAETTAAAIGSIVGALVILLDQFAGITLTTEATAAIVTLVSWIAAGVTWWVTRRRA